MVVVKGKKGRLRVTVRNYISKVLKIMVRILFCVFKTNGVTEFTF